MAADSHVVPTRRNEPDPPPGRACHRPVRWWPVLLLAMPAFVAIWSGWVGLGGLAGFGVVHPLPGIWDTLSLNTAITLPIGMETYAAFALRAWLSADVPVRARRFARRSAIAALALGAAGQVAYHVMSAAGVTAAPWWITTVVACLPVGVLGMGAALAHLLHDGTVWTEPRIEPVKQPPLTVLSPEPSTGPTTSATAPATAAVVDDALAWAVDELAAGRSAGRKVVLEEFGHRGLTDYQSRQVAAKAKTRKQQPRLAMAQ